MQYLKKPEIKSKNSFTKEQFHLFYETLIKLFHRDPENQTRIVNILNAWKTSSTSKSVNDFLLYLDRYCKSVSVKRTDLMSEENFKFLKSKKIKEYIKLRDKVISLLERNPAFLSFNPESKKLWYEPKCVKNNFPFAQFISFGKYKF